MRRVQWPWSSLGEVVEAVFDRRGVTPEKLGSSFVHAGHRVISAKHIKQSRVDLAAGEDRFVDAVTYSKWMKSRLQHGDVLVTSEAPLGEVAFVDRDLEWCLGQRLFGLRPRASVLNGRFLYFALRSRLVQDDIQSRATGTTAQGIRQPELLKVKVPVPPLTEQQAIAHILGTLDDKIDLNGRMNETLEAIARALFKSWFIDFDPVRAKMTGRIPLGMDSATAALFPSRLVTSPLGEVPVGWSATTLAQMTSKIGSGATPRGGDRAYVLQGTAFIRSQNVYDSEFVWEGLVFISDIDSEQLRGVTVQPDDVLLNITGASILRTCVVEQSVLPARVNQHVAIVRAKPEVPARYLHFHLLRPQTKAYLLGFDAGASRQAVTKSHIESVPLVLPTQQVLQRFNETCTPLFSMVAKNREQARTLATLRDALLPRLLSGELRMQDAERQVEKVA